jgi:asparagine synthase (glutamine-hydrolysing)
VCGLAGGIGPGAAGSVDRVAVLAALHRRGPDSEGVWSEPDGSVLLLHRRLAIRDLSPAGAQPMVSASGTHVIAYNGELYALDGLRKRLSARRLRGTSDTEVLVEACAEWGIRRVLPELVGMFAFALWDRTQQELTLVRDRLGIKPLYWSHRAGRLSFASELGALRAIDPAPRELDRDAIVAYLRMNHFQGDRTVHADVRRLRPGERLTFRQGEVSVERWWDAAFELSPPRREVSSEEELLEHLDAAIVTAVRDRLVSDVPIGSLLSGGIDSTLVTSIMAEATPQPVKTFTVGVEDERFDESHQAGAIARYLGCEHTEVRLSATEALDVIPRLPEIFGEPFADASAIPTALIFAHVKPSLTVTMSGDGGDEVFAGYPHHWRTVRLLRSVARIPPLFRSPASSTLGGLGVMFDGLGSVLGADRSSGMARRLRKAVGVVGAHEVGDAYHRVMSQWADPGRFVPGACEPSSLFDDPVIRDRFPDPLERIQILDLLGSLPDDILTKVDRTSMWSSVEARVPLLDHRLLAVASGLPQHLRVDRGRGKVALRVLLSRRVPPALWDRPKRGFGVPLDTWLRGPLREWTEDLLSPMSLSRSGIGDVTRIQEEWRRFIRGSGTASGVWGLLMLEQWIRSSQTEVVA